MITRSWTDDKSIAHLVSNVNSCIVSDTESERFGVKKNEKLTTIARSVMTTEKICDIINNTDETHWVLVSLYLNIMIISLRR